jgi:hypothetical protein
MIAIAIFSGNCRDTGELGVVAALTVTTFSLLDLVFRINALKAQGAAFAAIVAFLRFLLRAPIESRSRP